MPNIHVTLTHVCTPFVVENIHKAAELDNFFVIYDNTNNTFDPAKFDTFTIVDLTTGAIPKLTRGRAILLTNYALYQSISPLHKISRDTYDAPISLAYRTIDIPFDYLWFFENDVAVNGNWTETFAKCTESTDFLAFEVEPWHPGHRWGGWNSLHYYPVPLERRWKAFVPTARYSNRFVKLINDNLGIISGWVESYYATLAHEHGLSVGNLPQDMFGSMYTWHSPNGLAIFNAACEANPNENRLYHPIKG
jgi:hypothetical protein